MPEPHEWESYEEVAAHLINEFRTKFGLEQVEGKQTVVGERSGTEWEIDAKGVRVGGSGFVIVECRRWLKAKQKQENVGALAYRILDTGADGAIIVSPLGIQDGAEKIATAENIVEIRLDPDSTKTDYVLRFLNDVMIGVSDSIALKEEITCEIEHSDATTETRNIE